VISHENSSAIGIVAIVFMSSFFSAMKREPASWFACAFSSLCITRASPKNSSGMTPSRT
jgi:hypothetical protein